MIHHYPDKFPESISLHSINIKTSILWRPHLFLSNTSGAEPILIFSWLWLDTDTEPVIPGDKNIMIFKGYLMMSLVTESLRIGNSNEIFCLTANKTFVRKVILQIKLRMCNTKLSYWPGVNMCTVNMYCILYTMYFVLLEQCQSQYEVMHGSKWSKTYLHKIFS